VFTGGVGEHSPEVRELAASGLGFLGVGLGEQANAGGDPERAIRTSDSPVGVLMITAREDLEIAKETRSVLGDARG
jgi:acetate kinase